MSTVPWREAEREVKGEEKIKCQTRRSVARGLLDEIPTPASSGGEPRNFISKQPHFAGVCVCMCVCGFMSGCVCLGVCVCALGVGFCFFRGITVHLKAVFSRPCPEYFDLHRLHYSCKQRSHQRESRESPISGLRPSAWQSGYLGGG